MYCVYIWICIMTLLNSTLKAPVSNIHFLAFLHIFFSKGSNVSRSSFNGSKSNPHPPNTPAQHPAPGRRDRSKDTTDGVAVLQMPSMKWWCTWLPCCLFFTVLEPSFFKSYAISVFIPGGSLTMALEGFFLSFTTLHQATQNYQSTWIISTKKR